MRSQLKALCAAAPCRRAAVAFALLSSPSAAAPGQLGELCVPRWPCEAWPIQSPSSMTAADVDGNGVLDLWVAGQPSGLWLLRDVRGFQPTPTLSLGVSGGDRISTVVGDWNGDGHDDVARVPGRSFWGNDPVFWALSDGAGGVQGIQSLPFYTVSNSLSGGIALDWNADGIDDLLHWHTASSVARLARGTSGGLVSAGTVALPIVPHAVLCADIDLDGWQDLAVVGYPNVTFARNAGNGTFTALGSHALDWYLWDTFTFIDFDGDGDPDFASIDDSAQLRVLENVAGGSYVPRPPSPASQGWDKLRAMDWDRDGREDLLFAVGGSQLAWSRSALAGVFEPPIVLDTPHGPSNPIAHDLDGDGDLDLALFSGEALLAEALVVLEARGTTLVGPTRSPAPLPESGQLGVLAFADLDADGFTDVVGGGAGVRLRYGLANGPGRVGALQELSVDLFDSPLACGDLDGDGASEVLAATSNELRLWRGVPGGTPVLHAAYALTSPVRGLALDDFDRDGRLDLARAESGGALRVFRGDGALGLSEVWQGPAGFQPIGLEVFDADRDGRLDLVTYGRGSFDLLVHRGLGDGSFTLLSSTVFGAGARAIDSGDVDGDGRIDVIVHFDLATQLSVFLNRTGGFVPGPAISLGEQPSRAFGLADLDADSVADLWYLSPSTRRVKLCSGRGDGTFEAARGYSIGGRSFAAGVHDLDSDGRLEFVLYQQGQFSGSPTAFLAVLPHDGGTPARYCVAEPDSAGCRASLALDGCASLSTGALLVSSGLPSGRSALVFYGAARAALPLSGATLCIAPPLRRTAVQPTGGSGNCGGSLAFDLAAWANSGAAPGWIVGSRWCFQAFYRGGALAVGLSDAVELSFAP